jgi:phospholipid/cholesterol/gamma-HCH transport system ATP-binding protein
MVRAEGINKTFGDNQVLFDIDAQFEQGKTNLIIGRSGSGKTVLLKSLVGLHDIDSGSVYFHDTEFTSLSFKEKKSLRRHVGMLFQGGALFDSYTVEENVMFPLNLFQEMSYAEKLERVNFCLKRVNLENVNKLFPSELSGGMQKRVAIARAIVQNPRYLFCDEPNSGLDPRTAIVIDNLISEITKEFDITTIINTHDMNSVMEIGEKVVFIYQGNKCWEGTKDDIFTSGNKHLDEFIFASKLAKKVKETM